MLFGEKTRFGIEFELNEHSGGAWMFGKLCYWIGGEQVGDFDEGTFLRDVLFSMRYIVDDAGKRTAPALASCDEAEIFDAIHDSINESGRNLIGLIPSDLLPAYFDVCPNVDIFNDWNIYLVEAKNLSKIVYSSDAGNNVRKVELSPGEFDGVASIAHQELDRLFEASQ